MTQNHHLSELISALGAAGLSQERFCRLTGEDAETVADWCRTDSAPQCAIAYVDLWCRLQTLGAVLIEAIDDGLKVPEYE